MDDLSSFVEGLVSHLGRAYFLAGFAPALVFIAVNQYLLFSPIWGGGAVWNFFPEVTTPWLGLFTGEMLTTVVLSLVLGLVLVVLNPFIIRLFEGLPLLSRLLLFPLRARNLARHRARYADIAAKAAAHREILARLEQTGDYDETADVALFGDLDRLHTEKEKREPVQTLPYERARVSATAFGNVWAIMEEYPLRRYGMDGMLFWPYIREVISQKNSHLLEELDNQKQIIDVVVNLALVCGFLMLEALVLGLVRVQIPLLVIAAVALALFYVLYQSSVAYSRTLATLVTKGYDLYRLQVLDAFGIIRPSTLDDEYWVWSRLAAFLRRGEPFYFEMLDRVELAEGETQT